MSNTNADGRNDAPNLINPDPDVDGGAMPSGNDEPDEALPEPDKDESNS